MTQEAYRRGDAASVEILRRVGALAAARIAVHQEASDEATAVLEEAAARLVRRLAVLQDQGAELDQVQFTHRRAVRGYQDARRRLAGHAVAIYVANPELGIANNLLRTGNLGEAATSGQLLRAVLDADRRLLVESYIAASAGPDDLEQRAAELASAAQMVHAMSREHQELVAMVSAANQDLATALSLDVPWTFPVGGDRDHSYVDSFLAPRMAGTSAAHRHQGVDIFAALGTPVVAVERGVVGRVGEVSLGGLRVWLLGETGTNYYYAHLSRFADGLTEGQFVEAGTVLGFVGTTGNAVGTSPHLHFQVHPDGGAAVNPYPLLRRVDPGESTGAA